MFSKILIYLRKCTFHIFFKSTFGLNAHKGVMTTYMWFNSLSLNCHMTNTAGTLVPCPGKVIPFYS